MEIDNSGNVSGLEMKFRRSTDRATRENRGNDISFLLIGIQGNEL